MTEASTMSPQMILEVILSVTFLRGSEDGLSLSSKRDGLKTDKSGQDLAHASRSARHKVESKEGLKTNATYGPNFSGLFGSVALTCALESKLRQKTVSRGSTLYQMTWKRRATSLGRVIPALRATVHRTSDSVSIGLRKIGWRTPSARDFKGGYFGGRMDKEGHFLTTCLDQTAQLTGWTTPSARDHFDTPGMNFVRKDGKSRIDQLPRQAFQVGPCRLTASGEILTGSSAKITSGGQLNPDLPRWLMGFPIEHLLSGAMAMQSFSRKQKRS